MLRFFLSCKRYLFVFLFLFCCTSLFSLPKEVGAEIPRLMLHPIRLIFNDRQRALKLFVSNPTHDQIEYSISLVAMRKGQDGQWFVPEKPTAQDNKILKMIRYSPRKSRIAGKSKQVVKLMVRKPADLPKGEYRAMLQLTPINKKTSIKKRAEGKTELDVKVIVSSRFLILIQHQEDLPAVTPIELSLIDDKNSPTKKAVEVVYQRKGDFSSSGTVDVFYLAPGESKWRRVSEEIWMSIYTPDTRRKRIIQLKNITDEELAKGMLRLEYRHNNGSQKRKRQPDSERDFRL